MHKYTHTKTQTHMHTCTKKHTHKHIRTNTHTHTPNAPDEGEGLIYAKGSCDSLGMRVLSASIEPPVLDEDGSTVYVHNKTTPFIARTLCYTQTGTDDITYVISNITTQQR